MKELQSGIKMTEKWNYIDETKKLSMH